MNQDGRMDPYRFRLQPFFPSLPININALPAGATKSFCGEPIKQWCYLKFSIIMKDVLSPTFCFDTHFIHERIPLYTVYRYATAPSFLYFYSRV